MANLGILLLCWPWPHNQNFICCGIYNDPRASSFLTLLVPRPLISLCVLILSQMHIRDIVLYCHCVTKGREMFFVVLRDPFLFLSVCGLFPIPTLKNLSKFRCWKCFAYRWHYVTPRPSFSAIWNIWPCIQSVCCGDVLRKVFSLASWH